MGGNLEKRNCCVCVWIKKTLEFVNRSVFANLLGCYRWCFFLNDKVFCQYLLQTPRFLLLSLKLVEVFYIWLVVCFGEGSRPPHYHPPGGWWCVSVKEVIMSSRTMWCLWALRLPWTYGYSCCDIRSWGELRSLTVLVMVAYLNSRISRPSGRCRTSQ